METIRRAGRHLTARNQRHGRHRRGWALVVVVLGLLAVTPALLADTHTDPVATAFERARDTGSYHFTSDVEAVTAPLASAQNAGASSITDHLHLEGAVDLANAESEFSLWTDASSVYADDGSVGFRTVHDTTYQRRGDGSWEESATAAPGFAPRGDQLSLLRGAANVVDLGPVPGADAVRHGFDIDGAEFAAAIAREMETSLRDQGDLPAGVRVAIPAQYRDMAGTGELWVDESTGLPVRVVMTVQFPPQDDETVTATITTDFARFGFASAGPASFVDRFVLDPIAAGGRLGLHLAPIAAIALAVFVLARRHPSVARTALIVVLAVGVLVGGPIASTASAMTTTVDAVSSPAGPAAASAMDQIADLQRRVRLEGTSAIDPHLDRRAAVSSPVLLQGTDGDGDGLSDDEEQEFGTDPGIPDTDGDGLTDGEEVQIGTDPTSSDTDGDGHSDLTELEGFTLPGGTTVWYPDPNIADSNEDGIPDSIEWDITGSGAPSDSDGDGVPDLFDTDNDGDGVPDHRDISPFTAGTQTFDDENPLALTLDGLTPGAIPTFVQFQLRPGDVSHLQHALRPLDWPSDALGQIRDVNDSPDDLSLVPMLEIRFPTNAAVVPDADALQPYSVRLNDGDDPDTAYVPLSMVTDERSGEKVAFGGRMRYQSPAAGQDWGSAHEVRLTWAVRVDNDIACTPGDPDPIPSDPVAPVDSVCGADGYRYDRPQTVHTYFGDWTLTGLQVTEEHGAHTAVIHEDPAVDDDALENGPTWALADVLSERFLTAIPDGAGNDVYALEIDGLAARFDHASATTAESRYGLPDVFSVEERDHVTFDDAMRTVTEDIYDDVLPRYGAPDGWDPTDSPMPLVMTAYASDSRTVSLDEMSIGDGRVGWAGHDLRVDFVPAVGRDRAAGVTWSSYCGGSGSSPVWSRCEVDQVGDRLEDRYSDLNVDPEDPTRPYDESTAGPLDDAMVRGQNIVMMGYYLAVSNGISTMLSTTDAGGTTTNIAPYVPESDEDLRARVQGGARVAKTVAQMVHNKYLENTLPHLKRSLSIKQNAAAQIYRKIAARGTISTMKSLVPKGLLVGAAVVSIVALGVAVAFAIDGDPDAQVALGITASVAGTVASLTIFVPFANVVRDAARVGGTAASHLTKSSRVLGITKTATAIGTVIILGVVWGFFIAEMVGNGIVAGTPAFNAALSTVLATSIFIVLLAVLSLSLVGALLVAVVAAIDGILSLICEVGSDDDRDRLTVDGQCFTIGGSIVTLLADFLYSYKPLVDLERSDLVSIAVPDDEPMFQLSTPAEGYAVDNGLDVTLDVTSTLRHLRPDNDFTVKPYYYSADTLTSATFEYSVSSPEPETTGLSAELGDMRPNWDSPSGWGSTYAWANLLETSNTQRVESPGAIAFREAGIGRPFQYHLNMAYAVPTLECWLPYLAGGFCDVEPFTGTNANSFDPVHFDVFPKTIDEFLATTPTTGGHRLAWDPAFEAMDDLDGDGLRSAASGGLDPDDGAWDTDGDGLSDAFEFAQRETGQAFSATSADTDGDGLDDADEFRFGTDPAVVDTDRDGLSDAEEIDGWEITLGSTGRTVRVTSDPLAADTDFDGIGDEAERFLAEGGHLDEADRAFHPRAANIPPLSVTLTSDAPGGFVRSGDQIELETTVEATAPLAPSVLDLDTPLDDPLPSLVEFDPATFEDRQIITRTDTVEIPDGAVGDLGIGAEVRGRLVQDELPPDLALTERQAKDSSDSRAWMDVVPMRVDTRNSFAMVDESHDWNRFGSVWQRVPGTGLGSTPELDQDIDNTVSPARDDWGQRKSGGVTTACTDDAECMSVWPYAQNCMSVSVNSIRVDDVSDQNNDAELGVYLNRTSGAFELGRFEQLWHSVADGPGSLDVGSTTAIDKQADLCGFGYLSVVETDGEDEVGLGNCDGAAPAATNCKPLMHRSPSGQLELRELTLVTGAGDTPKLGTFDATFAFQDCPDHCDKVVVNYTLKAGFAAVNGQVDRLAATVTVTAPDGPTAGKPDITRPQFGVSAVNATVHDHAPAIASDGDRFLLVWTRTTDMPDGRVAVEFKAREYDRTGAAVGSELLVESAYFQQPSDPIPTLDVAWARGRAPVIVANRGLPAGKTWTFVKPLPSTSSTPDAVDLAIDTQSGVATAVHQTADGIYATWFQADAGQVSAALGTRRVIMLGAGNANALASPVVARAPGVGGWLIGARYVGPDNADVVAGRFSDTYFLTTQTPRGNPSAPATPGELVKLDAGFALRPSLACATGDSSPVVDLRFEELPGTTEFRDSSRLENHGTNPAGPLPAAGFAAAPAPDSDFAASLRLPSEIELPTAAGEATSFALWVKHDPGSDTPERFVWVRDPQADGYELDIRTRSVEWNAGGTTRTEMGNGGSRPLPLDGDWHHVVVTRSAAGTGAIYVDGTSWAQGFAMGDPSDGQLQIIGDGVFIDDFKMFDRALAPHEVEALMVDTPIDRCVLVAVENEDTADADRYPWAELTLTPHDPVAILLATAQMGLRVDDTGPTVSVAPLPGIVPGGSVDSPGTFILSGNATDTGSGVAGVEVSVDNGPYVAASGLDTWSYAVPVVDGSYQVRVRATDAVGNIGVVLRTIVVDGTAPEVSLDAVPGTPIAPGTDAATGSPTVRLAGSASDTASGLDISGVEVQLVPSPSGDVAVEENWQSAVLDGDRWTLDYRFSTTAIDVSGDWDVRVRATDRVGNVSPHDDVAALLRLDANAPEAKVGDRDAERPVIAGGDVLELGGQVTDDDGAGITELELSLTPLATLLALPDGATIDDLPEPPVWRPVALAESGAGVTETTWSFEITEPLEDSYQVDLRATDAAGNQAVRPNIWRGVIDTTAPRLVLGAVPTGELHTGGTRFEVRYDCSADDLFLDPSSFDCAGGSDAPAVKALDDDAAVQAAFPDLAQLTRMTTSFTRWERGPQTDVRFAACDRFGNCAAAEDIVDAEGIPVADLNVVVVDPTEGRHVAVDGSIDLGIIAEAEASIRSLEIVVDGSTVERRDFADGELTAYDARVPVDVDGGLHTVQVAIEDWVGSTEVSAPRTFFVDTRDPSVTLQSTEITSLDTWGTDSDTIRLHGDVSDDGTIASVEVKVDDSDWAEVIVDADGWRGALSAPDADGSDLTIHVRAFDLAGRSTTISESASIDLGSASPDFVAPDTVIVVGPSEETASQSASFLITKVAGSNEVVSLECSLDGGVPSPCAGLWTIDGLSAGPHRVEVSAIDSAGYRDLSPATWEWSVTPSGPQAELVDAPADPSSDRTPTIAFSSEPGATFECRLDDAAFESCTSPFSSPFLADGPHRFEVRATVAGTTGTAKPHVWSVVNAPPLAQDQAVTYGADPEGTSIDLLATDDDPVTYRIVDQPEHGLLEGAGPGRTYRPTTGFGGIDRFTFQAFDGEEWSNLATVTLDPSVPVVTWADPASIVYGTALTAEQLNASTTVAGTFIYEPAVGTRLGAGTHTLSVTFVPDDGDRYEDAEATVTIEVTQRPLQITASSGTHFYGTPPPAITPDFDGFATGDDAADLDVAPVCSSTSTEDSPVGEYESTCAGASDPDYDITTVDGTVTVRRAPTVLDLDDVSKVDSLRTKTIVFSASLRSDATGQGVEGAEVHFRFADGTPTCTAVTDADGEASCQVELTNEMRQLLLHEKDIEAVFDGSTNYHGSSDSSTTVQFVQDDGASDQRSESDGRATTQSVGGPTPLGAATDSTTESLATTGASTDRTTSLGLQMLAMGLLFCLAAATLIRVRRSGD